MKKYHKLFIGVVVVLLVMVLANLLHSGPVKPVKQFSEGALEGISSDNLEFTAALSGHPAYDIEDSPSSFVLTSGDWRIEIVRNATNHGNSMDYLAESDGRKKTLKVSEESNVVSAEGAWIFRRESYPEETTWSGYLWAHNWVYSISTSSPELYDEVEQIAKSFRYTGD